MEFTLINGVHVSRIGLGTWAIGGTEWGDVSDNDAVATCLAIFDHDINLIDTAPIYGRGHAEEIVGRAMRESGRRNHVYLATKAGLDWRDDGVYANSSPARLRKELEDSLRRLGTDFIDLYQIHWPDTTLPMEEVAEVMQRFCDEGKIRAIGVSNFSAPQMDAFRKIAPIHSNQPPYNIYERAIDRETLPYCNRHSIAVVAYSSLCRSLLAGRLTADTRFPPGDVRLQDPKFQPPRFHQYLAATRKLDEFAQKHYGKRVLHLAMRWVLDRPGISAALWGAKRPDQLKPLREVLNWSLDESAMRAIDQIVLETVTDPVGPDYLAPAVRHDS